MTNIRIENYCPTDGYNWEDIFLTNLMGVRVGDNLLPDTDGDGLSDRFETDPANIDKYGINVLTAFSLQAQVASQYYADLTLVTLGLDKNDRLNLRNCNTVSSNSSSAGTDSDNDALTDCEELLLGTDKNKPDSDGDGVPDGLEMRFGLNPLSPNDADLDPDQDGLSSYEEVRRNLPWNLSNTELISQQSFQYSNNTYVQNNKSCHNFLISNIPIIETPNGNHIIVYMIEKKLNPNNAVGGEITRLKVFNYWFPTSLLDNLELSITSSNINNNLASLVQTVCYDKTGLVMTCP